MLGLVTKNLFMEWVDDGIKFTLYDITKELRDRGNWIDHVDTKHYLDGYLNDLSKFNYERELKTFQNVGVSAYVYKPCQSVVGQSVVGQSVVGQSVVSKDKNIITPNKDNRLRLLSGHLAKINAQPNQKFAVSYNGNEIIIETYDKNLMMYYDKKYTVESKNTLRIKNKGDKNSQYKVEVVNGNSLKLVKV